MANVKLSAPWVRLYRQIEALFERDPQVRVVFDEDATTIKLFVDNAIKADALTQVLPEERVFGNVTAKIEVIPSNNDDPLALVQAAFDGNPALAYTQRVNTPLGEVRYAVFAPEVVQFFDDDMSNISGKCSTLYQDIAKDVLAADGVFFCTDDM